MRGELGFEVEHLVDACVCNCEVKTAESAFVHKQNSVKTKKMFESSYSNERGCLKKTKRRRRKNKLFLK